MKVEKIDSWYSRGWRGAAYVKRQTAKLIRREAKRAIKAERDDDPRSLRHVTHGWTS